MPVEGHLQMYSCAINENTLKVHNERVTVQLDHALCLTYRLLVPLNSFQGPDAAFLVLSL